MAIIIGEYARMWPRDIFFRRLRKGNSRKGPSSRKRYLFRDIPLLRKPGVYVLYRDDVPYYIGQATRLRTRLWAHACKPDGRYYNHWNFFSAFVIEDENQRNEIERIPYSGNANREQYEAPQEGKETTGNNQDGTGN